MEKQPWEKRVHILRGKTETNKTPQRKTKKNKNKKLAMFQELSGSKSREQELVEK